MSSKKKKVVDEEKVKEKKTQQSHIAAEQYIIDNNRFIQKNLNSLNLQSSKYTINISEWAVITTCPHTQRNKKQVRQYVFVIQLVS